MHLLACRFKALAATAAGLAPVCVAGIEDVDISGIITSHTEYERSMPQLLGLLGLESI